MLKKICKTRKNIDIYVELDHRLLAHLTVALAHGFLEDDRNGVFIFLVLFDLRAVIPSVSFIPGSSTHFANVRSEDWTNQLAGLRISQDMATVLVLGFAIVPTKFAFPSGTNSILRPGMLWLELSSNGRMVMMMNSRLL